MGGTSRKVISECQSFAPEAGLRLSTDFTLGSPSIPRVNALAGDTSPKFCMNSTC